jgi:hypothetical protein
VDIEIGSREVAHSSSSIRHHHGTYHGEIGTFAVIQPVGIALGDQSWQWYVLGLGDRREGLWSQPADFGVFARLRARRTRRRGRSQGVHSWHSVASVNSSGPRGGPQGGHQGGNQGSNQEGRQGGHQGGYHTLTSSHQGGNQGGNQGGHHLQQLERVLARPEQQTVTQRPVLMRIRIEPSDAQRT